MNHVALIGRLCADPEVVKTKANKTCCKFRLAVNRPFKNQAGEYDADFLSCVAWEKTGELIADRCVKGNQLAVEGRLNVRNYEYEGLKRTAYDVIVERVTFLGGSSKKEEKREAKQDDEDLPF